MLTRVPRDIRGRPHQLQLLRGQLSVNRGTQRVNKTQCLHTTRSAASGRRETGVSTHTNKHRKGYGDRRNANTVLSVLLTEFYIYVCVDTHTQTHTQSCVYA